jgi:nucleotide-binding universal stress UspA family protein
VKKILVGIDGSEVSNRALDEAIKLAKLSDGELVLAHSIELAAPPTELPMAAVMEYERGMREFAESLLTRALSRTKEAGVRAVSRVLIGGASYRLAEIAKSEKFDLLVIGSRGRGLLERALLGSTSSNLSHHCERPLLIVR